MKVRATHTGYYDHARRREGDVFTLTPQRKGDKEISPDQQFSKRWMERVQDDEPERTSTAQQALKRHHDETTRGARQQKATGDAEAI